MAVPSYTGLVTLTHKWNEIPEVVSINPVTIDTTKYFKFSSVQGRKRAQNVAVSDGALTNLLNKLSKPVIWPELKPGQNVISVSAAVAGRGQAWTLAYYNRFGAL